MYSFCLGAMLTKSTSSIFFSHGALNRKENDMRISMNLTDERIEKKRNDLQK